MIPYHLTLRNFLSYRDVAELDLRGVQLACISGLNGAGKSSILDGITWALFGKSRVKSDDDLVNRVTVADGAAAEVAFIFELEGAVYRIIRRKAAGKTTELEFHARAVGDEGDRWQTKTEAKVRETQAEIEKLLHMNYDVFTNASFLLQGKADEFTTKTADRRKEILAEILGVNQWDVYKDLATERRKETEYNVTAVDRQLAEVEAELAQEEELTLALELAEIQTKALTAERDRQDALVVVARQNKALADQQRELLRRTIIDLAESEREMERIETTTGQRRAELAGHRTILSRREAIESAVREWQSSEDDFAGWQERSERHAAIVREMHPLEMAVSKAQTQLEQRMRDLESQQQKVKTALIKRDELQTRLAVEKERREKLAARATELADQEREWQETKTRLEKLEYERKLRDQEINQLRSLALEFDNNEKERDQIEASRHAVAEALVKTEEKVKLLVEQGRQLADKNLEMAGIRTEQERLRKEMDEIKDRIQTLQAEEGQDCPLCGQPLTEDHRTNVIRQLRAEGEGQGAQYRRNKAALEMLAGEVETLKDALTKQPVIERERETQQASIMRAELRLQAIENSLIAWQENPKNSRLAELEATPAVSEADEVLRSRAELLKTAAGEARQLNQELRDLEKEIARNETQIEEVERLEREWHQIGRPALDDVKSQLSEHTYAVDEQAALAEIQLRLAAVGYDATAHLAARDRRAQLAGAPQEHLRLLQAEAAVKPLTDALMELERQRERIMTRLSDLRLQHERGDRRLEELEAGVGDLPAAEAELQRLREQVVTSIRAGGGARQKVEVLAVRREDRRVLTQTKTDLARRAGLLRQLEEACGRKGVQVLLIEAALPEIEDYANELLFRLTGGDMRVSFETQKAAKTKQDSLIETLDIKISDSTGGVRPYENYSGGEQFRVNFAIRLALSQVLARRAGARLRTLVIDEGFGSQDPEGRQRLVEAINAVQDKFACILVITHIDELRDKFPARIDVEKTPTGSRLSVVTI